MKFFNRKSITHKEIEVAKDSIQSFSVKRHKCGDYGISLCRSHPFNVPDSASFYGSKKELIKALEIALEQIKQL